MRKTYLLLAVVGIIIVSAIVLRFSTPEDEWYCQDGKWQKHGNPSAAMPTSPCEGATEIIDSASTTKISDQTVVIPTEDEGQATFSNEVIILNPKQNQLITSPLKVEGQALGSWFFEASLPVKLVDANNQVIVSHYGTALDDWMTEKPVKFSSDLVFSTNATSGFLIISKDNPSGLPQNDASISVPVRFK